MGDDERLASILGDWCDRVARGEEGDAEELCRAHPELADRIREGLEALELARRALRHDGDPGPGLPETLGDYRIVRELGTGGMGTVYLAEATADQTGIAAGEQVALKVIHPHLLSRPGFFKRFLREGELGRSVEHPHVVRTLDVDARVLDGRSHHFLVMEYVEGETLRELLNEYERIPEALLREIAAQTADGLAAIHEAGIVHRDLKPENVLITKDRRVRIMDLGVAKLTDAATALTGAGQFAGSLHYAAPEQFKRTEIGPAADLYSMGVLLYELATGSNPFRYEEASGVMHAHLEVVPRRANEDVPDLSDLLSEVLAALLEKDAGRRIPSAGRLCDIFAKGEDSAWWRDREGTILRAKAAVPRVPVRRETTLHGREADLESLREAWRQAGEGDAQVVLLEGEAGIGKSRLVDTFLQECGGEETHVLYGSYPPSGGLGGLSDAVLGHFGDAALEDALQPYLTVTPKLIPAFAALLRHEPAPDGAQPVQGDALHAVFCHLARALAAEKPLLWVVEDLHFAETESRQVLRSMAREVRGHRVLVLLTTRPGLPEDELSQLSCLDGFRRAGLGRLSAREVILLLRDAFHSEALAEKLGGRIALKSDGVPFFVFEMIRGLKEGQFITELPDGSYVESRIVDEIEVPSAVRDLIGVRLNDLTREEREILDLGAAYGFEFDVDLVGQVLERKRFGVLQDLADVERRSGVVRAAGRRFRFDHHQIQEIIYSEMSPVLREECHALLAEAYEKREGIEGSSRESLRGDSAAFLATHYLRSSRPEAGQAYVGAAVGHLHRSNRIEAALFLADGALTTSCVLDTGQRAALLRDKGHLLQLLGRFESAKRTLEEARDLAERAGERALVSRVEALIAWVHLHLQDADAAESLSQQSAEHAREAGDREAEANALFQLGQIHQFAGRLHDSAHHLERALEIYVDLGNAWDRGRCISALGLVRSLLGSHESGLELIEQGIDACRAVGNRRSEPECLRARAEVLHHLGRIQEAASSAAESLALYREIGNQEALAVQMSNVGSSLLWLGRTGEAEHRFLRALDLDRSPEQLASLGASAGLGRLYLRHHGLPEQAQPYVDRVVTLSQETGNPDFFFLAHWLSADLASFRGRLGEARRHLVRLLDITRDMRARTDEGWVLTRLGFVQLHLGAVDEACTKLRSGLALLQETRSRPNEAMALLGLAHGLAAAGDLPTSQLRAGDALSAFDQMGMRDHAAEARVVMGRILAARGQRRKAAATFTAARTTAAEIGLPTVSLVAEANLARLHEGDVRTVVTRLEARDGLAEHCARMEARFLVWEVAREPDHLRDAKRLLDQLVAHAPEAYRTSMVENVPLHRDIASAV